MAYTLKQGDLAGFDIIGWRQPDGSLCLGREKQSTSTTFPKEVALLGNVYTLEEVKLNLGPDGKPLPPTHPGHNIEWGIYV